MASAARTLPPLLEIPAAGRRFDVLAFGEAMVEFNQTGAEGGRLYLQGFGGDTSNFAVAAARQGARTGYISALGADPYARMLRDMWQAEGVDHSLVIENPQAFSAIYFVSHDANGHHFHFFRHGSAASHYHIADVPAQALTQTRAFHFSAISLAISESARNSALDAAELARDAGALVSFDTNLRLQLWSLRHARRVVQQAIELCDVCLPSFEDMVELTGQHHPDAMADHCLRHGARLVALKLGANGALIATAAERWRIAPHACQPIDATGAGDTFGGAFIARLLAGDPPQAAGHYANAAAALSTQGLGAVAPIPHAAAVLAALQAPSAPA